MKRIYFVILCLCALLCGCEKPNFLPSLKIGDVKVVSTTGSTVKLEIPLDYSYPNPTIDYYGIYYSSTNQEPGNLDLVAMEVFPGYATTLYITATGLSANTTYYARAFARNKYSIVVGEVFTFTTGGSVSVTTNTATNITDSEATLSGTIQKNGNVNIQKRGLLVNTSSNPTVENTSTKWEGTGVTGTYSITFQGLSSSTKYYYRAYAIADGETVYGAIRNFTTQASITPPSQTTYNVSQIMSVYSSLGLSSGSTSTETYTVRGYVTQWSSGYPNYQNADFFIDDNANSGSTQLKCFRLTGVKDTDKRTLVVGDYVEVQNCHLMNYNGQAELKDGTFTVITAASDPTTPTKGSSVSDFIGTWSLTAYDWDNSKNVSWDNVKISTWNNSETGLGTAWVWVSGLNEGYDFERAIGEYDPTIKGLRLYNGMYFSDDTYTVEGHGDTLFFSVFRTVYVSKDPLDWVAITNGGGFNGRGEIWVTFDSNGKLNFTSPSTPSSSGKYSNGYNFVGYYNESNKLLTYYDAYMDIQLTQESTSVSAPAKANRKTWHAPMRLDSKKLAGKPTLSWSDRY